MRNVHSANVIRLKAKTLCVQRSLGGMNRGVLMKLSHVMLCRVVNRGGCPPVCLLRPAQRLMGPSWVRQSDNRRTVQEGGVLKESLRRLEKPRLLHGAYVGPGVTAGNGAATIH